MLFKEENCFCLFFLDVKLLCEEIILHVVVLLVFNDVLFEVVLQMIN